MEKLWIVFIFTYSMLKGTRDAMKKAALKKSSSTEILFFFTLIGLILVLPFSASAFSIAPIFIFWAFVKAAVVCSAWLFSLATLKSISVGLYGIMDTSRVVFSTLLGVFALGEGYSLAKGIGMILVIVGLLLANLKKNTDSKRMTLPVLFAALMNCFLNAVSGTMDKVLMRYMESSQLQFWFMFFMTAIYGAIILVKREKISIRSIKTNYLIPLMSISLVVGDRLLFEANASPASEVTLMTVIKQSSVFITVITGAVFFKEKNVLYKLMCACVVLSGIFIALFV